MADGGDILLVTLLLLICAGIIHGLLTAKRRQIERMDDEDPFGEAEWRFGTPNDPVDEKAKPIDLNEKD